MLIWRHENKSTPLDNPAAVIESTIAATLVAFSHRLRHHPNERSYNQDFHQNLPTSPNYAIENVNDTDFHVIVHQGTPLKGIGSHHLCETSGLGCCCKRSQTQGLEKLGP